MKIYISKYANEDIRQLQEQDKKKVERVLHSIKRAETIRDIPNVMKVKGTKEPLFRIKITPYRMFFIEVSKVVNILSVVRRNEGTYKTR